MSPITISSLKRNTFDQAYLQSVGNACGTDKTTHHGYDRFYPLFLAPLRRLKNLGIVEIGYGQGESIPFWKTLFPQAHLYCLDRDVCLTGDGFEVLLVDQSDPGAVEAVIASIAHPVHLIIDDGSHLPPHQLSTLSVLLDQLLQPGGVYIVEDVETSYWISGDIYGYPTRYGLHNRWSAVEVLKLAVDYLNRSFLSPDDRSMVEYLMAMAGLSPTAAGQISTLTFAQNCMILTKALDRELPYLERRYFHAAKTVR